MRREAVRASSPAVETLLSTTTSANSTWSISRSDEGAFVFRPEALAPVAEKIVAGVVAQEVGRIDHGDHGVEPGDVRQALARGMAEVEGGGDGERLGDAGAFDQQVIEAVGLGEAAHLGQQVVAQGAADAAVGHLDQGFLGGGELRAAVADKVGVDVDLGHVVDDDRHAQPLAVGENGVEQRGLAGAEEAGEDGDGEAGVGHGGSVSRDVIT